MYLVKHCSSLLLLFSVVRSSLESLSSWSRWASIGTSLAALLCTLSSLSTSCLVYEDQAWMANSMWVCTWDLKRSDSILSRQMKVFLILPNTVLAEATALTTCAEGLRSGLPRLSPPESVSGSWLPCGHFSPSQYSWHCSSHWTLIAAFDFFPGLIPSVVTLLHAPQKGFDPFPMCSWVSASSSLASRLPWGILSKVPVQVHHINMVSFISGIFML